MRSVLWRACTTLSHWDPGLSCKALGARALATGGIDRDVMQYDVCIVGAGPAGLAAAIRAKQVCNDCGWNWFMSGVRSVHTFEYVDQCLLVLIFINEKCGVR